MTRHAIAAGLAIALATASIALAQRKSDPVADVDLVELDVVVTDRKGQPVPGLQREAFEVKDDGRVVDVKTFAEVRSRNAADAGGTGDDDDAGRRIVILLDDMTIPVSGTAIIRAIAEAFLAKAGPRDDVSVVRLGNDRDEPYGDRETAIDRIKEYRAPSVQFVDLATRQRALTAIADISRSIGAVEHQRKIVLCIGFPFVCNVTEPALAGYSQLWPAWVDAISASSRANVSVYAVMPTRPGSVRIFGGGVVEATGGDSFANTSKFDEFVDEVWRESGQYYLLGYWPQPSKHDVRSIDVKVAGKGLRVRVRRRR